MSPPHEFPVEKSLHFPRHLQLRYDRPHPALQPWVECYWSFRHKSNKVIEERLYPDGGSSLNFHFSNEASAGSWFSRTQNLRHMRVAAEMEVFGIRFYPGGAFALLGLAMEDLSEEIYQADELELSLDSLHAHLQEAEPDQRSGVADDWLLNRVCRGDISKGLVQQLWPRLAYEDHPLDYYLKDISSGRRKLERLFRLQVGTSPRQLRILHRIKHARSFIKTRAGTSLTEIAQLCGFYDQAHFVRQFQTVTGLTPGQYRQRYRTQSAEGDMNTLTESR